MREQVFIFDIDGTVADGTHRKHHIETDDPKNKDWKSYNKKMGHDTPIDPVRRVFWALTQIYPVLLLSGREDAFSTVTTFWLHEHGIVNYRDFFMREAGDHRSDDIVKEEILDKFILPRYDVIGVFDDRPRVTKMWKRRGIFVFDVYQDPDRKEF